MARIFWLLLILLGMSDQARVFSQSPPTPKGVEINYQLPTDGPLPKTYCVTLAIVDSKNPDWIISQFACAVPRTVTTENRGKFTETWDGLDDNFMPVPPGNYAVKGIYTPAHKWIVDGEYHAITPRFLSGVSSWLPSPDQWNQPDPFGGDTAGKPLEDVAVGPNGQAVFYYVYLENGLNNPRFDLNKPLGYDQFLGAFPSGGAGGGTCTATDGETVWSFSTDGGPKYVYRADRKPFGTGSGNRQNVYRPDGWVTAMAALHDEATRKSYVYVAQRGRIKQLSRRTYVESEQEFTDIISIHDGVTGAVLNTTPIYHPAGLAISHQRLYALHAEATGGFTVSSISLMAGLPRGGWQKLFRVPDSLQPFDLEVDSHGRIYLSAPAENRVYQFNEIGKTLRTYGRMERQKPGTYDPLTLMSPGKLATWTDRQGQDRLIIVEQAGPNRASEWSAGGELLREFQNLQTRANSGYAIDPERPEDVYTLGHQGWLTRWHLNYTTGVWAVNAVWPDLGTEPKLPGLDHIQLLVHNGVRYLVGGRTYNLYRLENNLWRLSAGLVRVRDGKTQQYYFWADENGDGRVQEEEYRRTPTTLPGAVLRYHGEHWLDDLSLVALNQKGQDAWRLAPDHFDGRGNPCFKTWTKLLTDPVLQARAQGKVDAIHGGNELTDRFDSDWAMVDGDMTQGFYVNARGGPNFSANEGAQIKISRYVPDGKGGFRLKWRTGRKVLQGTAQRGEIYSSINIHRPINGLIAVIDQSRCGVLLYTEDGLYVDTLFPDNRRFRPSVAGVYPQPGEFFVGMVYPNHDNGKIYFGMGKYTPMLYAAEGWSLKENPVHTLENLPASVRLLSSQIARPPEIALSVRGGGGNARVAHFAPVLGGVVLDGSLTGWETADPVRFQADAQQSVEVRCLYDPGHLYLRWHARLPAKIVPGSLSSLERIFTHEQQADTLSFYIQGDPRAKPSASADGRAGDVRFVFALARTGNLVQPVCLGMYPEWNGKTQASPQIYATPVGKVSFAHVGPVPDARLYHVMDEDGKGFVLTAALPREAIPALPPLTGDLSTMVNFEATFGGHNKFWWANSDGSASRETYDEPTEARLYPGSWAPAQFQGVDKGVVVRNWLVCGPWGGPGAEKFTADLRSDAKKAGQLFCDAAQYPPDRELPDTNKGYTGPLIQGYWPDPKTVRWKPKTVADLDTRVILGTSAQVWYGAAWIYAPTETELDFQFQGHPQTFLRFFLNSQSVLSGQIPREPTTKQSVAVRRLKLKPGWNSLLFRGYCVGYSPFRAGLVLQGPSEKLLSLRLTDTPPVGQKP